MFNQIHEYIDQTKLLSKEGMEMVKYFTDQLLNKTSELQKTFEKLKLKYGIENSTDITTDKVIINGKEYYYNHDKKYHYNRVEFWRDNFEFPMSIRFDGQIDGEFMLITQLSQFIKH